MFKTKISCIKISFYPRPIRLEESCRALRRLPVRPLDRPVLVIALHPTIFSGFCSYLIQPLTLVGAWTLQIMDLYVNFSRILWHFINFDEYTDLLVFGARPCYDSTAHTICGSCSNIGQPLALATAWTMLLMGSLYVYLFRILWPFWKFGEYRPTGVLSSVSLPLYSQHYFMTPVHIWYNYWP